MMYLIILSVWEGRSICWILIYTLRILGEEPVDVAVADLVVVVVVVVVAVVVHVVLVVLHVMDRLVLGWVALVMLEALE
jgi:hypothetical protein